MRLIGLGFLIGRPTGLRFDPSLPYAGCRICGRVFQPTDAKVNDPATELTLTLWRVSHNKQHKEHEHILLQRSGLWATPEAAAKLSTLGIIDMGGAVLSDETAHALRVINGTPTEDAEHAVRNRVRRWFPQRSRVRG